VKRRPQRCTSLEQLLQFHFVLNHRESANVSDWSASTIVTEAVVEFLKTAAAADV
jgi:hypothetical protein